MVLHHTISIYQDNDKFTLVIDDTARHDMTAADVASQIGCFVSSVYDADTKHIWRYTPQGYRCTCCGMPPSRNYLGKVFLSDYCPGCGTYLGG